MMDEPPERQLGKKMQENESGREMEMVETDTTETSQSSSGSSSSPSTSTPALAPNTTTPKDAEKTTNRGALTNGNGGVASERRSRRGRDTRPKDLHVDLVSPLPSPSADVEAGKISPSSSHPHSNSKNDPDQNKAKKDTKKATTGSKWSLPPALQWIPDNWTWSKLKPVIRCAVVAWASALLFIVPSVQRWMGQAAFLILIASILSPPSDPFISVLERETLILLFSTLSWAWSCLGMYLASISRTRFPSSSLPSYAKDPTSPRLFEEAIKGQWVEWRSSLVMLVWLAVGTMVWLYVRAVQGPGPFLFACVFAIICLDICTTTSALFPVPFYLIGKTVLVPLALHSTISLVGSVLIFPSSGSALFTGRLSEIVGLLGEAVEGHGEAFAGGAKEGRDKGREDDEEKEDGDEEEKDKEFSKKIKSIAGLTSKAESLLLPLSSSTRLLTSDLLYSRYSPGDYKPFQDLARRMVNRAEGMGVYFGLVEGWLGVGGVRDGVGGLGTGVGMGTPGVSRVVSGVGSGVMSGGESRVASRIGSRVASRVASLERPDPASGTATPRTPRTPTTPRHGGHTHGHGHEHGGGGHTHTHHYWRHHHHHVLADALRDVKRKGHRRERYEEPMVGVFESQKYMNLELERFHDPEAGRWVGVGRGLVGESCTPLLQTLHTSLSSIQTWLDTARHGRLRYLLNPRKVRGEWEGMREGHEREREELVGVLGRFRGDERFRVLEPWRGSFERRMRRMERRRRGEDDGEEREQDLEDEEEMMKTPAHRYLFHCFVYQYHLIQLAEVVGEMMDQMIALEKKRTHNRLWTPAGRLIKWRRWEVSETYSAAAAGGEVDEDPDAIQGLNPTTLADLGLPQRRDPDALPPRTLLESIMTWVYHSVTGLAGGNVLFAVKAAVLAVILGVPSVVRGSAGFAYDNRFVWGIIMGQITLARFRGDTIFGFFARVASTFLGGAVGMAMWYISCGSGRGNPYGLAVVFGVCCPFMFYARLYYSGAPMTQIVFFVTICLVVGYSYVDVTQTIPGSPGFGFTVWWRRCVLVTVGVFAAFIFSFLPPSTTIRRYTRATLSTTCSELGAIYCAILSYANHRSKEEEPEINASLLAVRSKLKRSIVLRTNVVYEFSLRGRWPVERYNMLCDIQIQIAYHLAHFMSVVKHLEPQWARALLRRTRFMDTDFQGEILAVLTMISSALRTGYPLPQITPGPLLDRFLTQSSGLDILKKETEEDFGLPKTLTLETLMNEQYLFFCVGVSTAFGIMARLDRLMVAAKEIVGEHYHIHGIGFAPTVTRQTEADVSGPAEETFRPPQGDEV